ncbi:MAG: hypothetical protein ABW175_13560 [Bradyrhizobium sp.]
MAAEVGRAEGGEVVPDPGREVEFALMLSRVIDSVENNPEFLRATVYELARHKLKEEFNSESPGNVRSLSKSLEIAIAGVESFSKKKGGMETSLLGANPARATPLLSSHPSNPHVASALESASPVFEAHVFGSGAAPPRKRSFKFDTSRWLTSAAIALAVISTVVSLGLLRNKGYFGSQPAPAASKATTAAPAEVAAKAAAPKPVEPSPTVPTAFGIYAVSNDKLFELDTLPGRAPDPRVAISGIFTTPSRTTLPDGHVSFVIYRRDSASTAADRAEVRVVARIEREATFDKGGKQVLTGVDDNWVIRNISIPHRTSPKKDNPEMYEVRSDNPDAPLAPGRYALVLKGVAYDFTVAGTITDPRQCLERLVATNGRFYSECKK